VGPMGLPGVFCHMVVSLESWEAGPSGKLGICPWSCQGIGTKRVWSPSSTVMNQEFSTWGTGS